MQSIYREWRKDSEIGPLASPHHRIHPRPQAGFFPSAFLKALVLSDYRIRKAQQF